MVHAHPKFAYEKGLHQIGNGAYAWLQPDGGWGWSNSGLVVDSGEALVIDTLFDVPLTQDMLRAYADASPDARQINTLVNTHHNGDHCNGNCCCPDAQIIAHRATALHMQEETPALVQGFLDMAPELGVLGDYLTSCFGPFDFPSVTQKLPDTLIDDETEINIGDKKFSSYPSARRTRRAIRWFMCRPIKLFIQAIFYLLADIRLFGRGPCKIGSMPVTVF